MSTDLGRCGRGGGRRGATAACALPRPRRPAAPAPAPNVHRQTLAQCNTHALCASPGLHIGEGMFCRGSARPDLVLDLVLRGQHLFLLSGTTIRHLSTARRVGRYPHALCRYRTSNST
eukprot:3941986-Rhodomonas_salina.3